MHFNNVTPSLFGTQYSSSFEPTYKGRDSTVSSVARKFFGICAAISGAAFLATGSPTALSLFCISSLLALSFSSTRTSYVYRDNYQSRQNPPPRQQPNLFPGYFPGHFPGQQRDPVGRRQEAIHVQYPPPPPPRQDRVVALPTDAFVPTAPSTFERHQPESQQRHERVVELPQNPFVPTVQDPFERHQPDSTRHEPQGEDLFARHEVGK